MLAGARFDREAMRAAAADELVAATDVADLLVRLGTPFREAHGVVAGLVRGALEAGKPISELDEQELAVHSRLLAAHREELLRGARPGRAGWSRRSPRADRDARVGAARAGPRRARAHAAHERRPRGATVALRGVTQTPQRRRRPRRGSGLLRALPSLEVARELIGCRVVHGGTEGVIVETEAYHESEPACHAFVGLTPRTSTLFGAPGRAYVYRSYGIHAMLNAVCEPEGWGGGADPGARPDRGDCERMRERRGGRGSGERELCSGPGKLTQALGIELDDNGIDLATGPVRILAPAPGRPAPGAGGQAGGHHPRRELPWRFARRATPTSRAPAPARALGGGRGRRRLRPRRRRGARRRLLGRRRSRRGACSALRGTAPEWRGRCSGVAWVCSVGAGGRGRG